MQRHSRDDDLTNLEFNCMS